MWLILTGHQRSYFSYHTKSKLHKPAPRQMLFLPPRLCICFAKYIFSVACCCVPPPPHVTRGSQACEPHFPDGPWGLPGTELDTFNTDPRQMTPAATIIRKMTQIFLTDEHTNKGEHHHHGSVCSNWTLTLNMDSIPMSFFWACKQQILVYWLSFAHNLFHLIMSRLMFSSICNNTLDYKLQ